jgi:excisionase family DNA binding protein
VAGTKRQVRECATANGIGAADVPIDAGFTIDDLVISLKLPKSTTYKLAQKRKIPGQKAGQHWRFHRETIDQWLSCKYKAPPR